MFCRKCMCNKTSFLSDFARLTELGDFPRTSPCPRATVLLCASDEAATLSFPRRGPAASCLSCERDEESKARVEGPAHCSCCSSAMSSCDSPSTLLLLAPCNSSCARRKVTASVIAASPIAVLPRKTPKTGSCLGEQVLKLLETPKELTGKVERFYCQFHESCRLEILFSFRPDFASQRSSGAQRRHNAACSKTRPRTRRQRSSAGLGHFFPASPRLKAHSDAP